MYVASRWPYTAIEPCRGVAFGLISMLAVGLGLIPWTIAFGIILWRMPATVFWRGVKLAAMLSYACVIASISWGLFDFQSVYDTIGIELLFAIFSLSLLIHYACVFAVAVNITRSARMVGAMWVAIVCGAAQGAVVLFVVIVTRFIDGVVGLLILSSLWWMLFGTFYWSYLANTLDQQRRVLIRNATGVRQDPIPTQRV